MESGITKQEHIKEAVELCDIWTESVSVWAVVEWTREGEKEMYQNCCEKCGSVSLYTEVKGNNTGLYCSECGKWQRWLGKDELRVFENRYGKNSKLSNKDITTRLEKFVEFLENKIDSEYDNLPNSKDDAIRKNVCCTIMERDKNAILNILNGHDFNYVEE